MTRLEFISNDRDYCLVFFGPNIIADIEKVKDDPELWRYQGRDIGVEIIRGGISNNYQNAKQRVFKQVERNRAKLVKMIHRNPLVSSVYPAKHPTVKAGGVITARHPVTSGAQNGR